MKKLILFIISIIVFALYPAHSVVIKEFQFEGLSKSDTNTILHFFHENVDDKDWNIADLDKTLKRVAERMTITGWFRDVSISNISTNANEAVLLFKFQERIQYTAWLGNLYVGITKFNLWGKGKLVSFEVGPYRQLCIIEDRMFLFSRFSYSVILGAKEFNWLTYASSQYTETKILSRIVTADIGFRVIPDGLVHLIFGSTKLEGLTNKIKIDTYFDAGIRLSYNRTAGFPAINKGWNATIDALYIFGPNVFKTEFSAKFYQKLSKRFHLSEAIHGGYISSSSIPTYHMFSLRHIDGLRTFTQGLDGMIGTTVWDAHLELRWAFWDIIPFLYIFDLQIEAIVFIETGEARINTADLGKPHFVYGGGLRFSMNTFIVRAEMGIDETGESSVSASFGAAF